MAVEYWRMICEIEYLNARLWGMKGFLLPEGLQETLLSVSSREEWIAALLDTPYGGFLGPSIDRRDSRSLYRAVDASIASRTHRLTHIASGKPAQALRICLAEQDHQNLITISSGIHNQVNPLEILSGTVPGGTLGSEQIEVLARCGTTREVADRLATWTYGYHTVYRNTFVSQAKKPLLELRLEFTREFMKILLADARSCGYKVIRNFMGEKADRINLISALMWRSLPSDRDPMEFHIPGGPSITGRVFKKMLQASDLQQVIGCLPYGPFKQSAEKAAAVQADTETVSLFETSLEWQIVHRYSRPLSIDPLGAELLLAYLLRLRREGIRLKQSLTRLLFEIPAEVFPEISGYV